MKRLQARDQEERNSNGPLPERRGGKEKKKTMSKQPVYVRVAGDVCNLLHDGSIRTTLEPWQRHIKARAAIARLFCIQLVHQEARELGSVVKRTQSAELHDFESMSNVQRLARVAVFVLNNKAKFATSEELERNAMWPEETKGEPEDELLKQESAKPTKRTKIAAPDEKGKEEADEYDDDIGKFDEEEAEAEEEEEEEEEEGEEEEEEEE